MSTNLKKTSVLVALVCVAVGCMTGSASAVTAQLAKKCQALTAQAFPPLVPGNPAAGSAKGTVSTGLLQQMLGQWGQTG